VLGAKHRVPNFPNSHTQIGFLVKAVCPIQTEFSED